MTTATDSFLRRRPGLLGALLTVALLTIGAFGANTASADQAFEFTDSVVLDPVGDPVTQAGATPDTFITTAVAAVAPGVEHTGIYPIERPKDVRVDLPPGFVGNPLAIPSCPLATFLSNYTKPACPLESVIGYASLYYGAEVVFWMPVYNLGPANGTPAVLGLTLLGVASFAQASLRTGDDYGVTVTARNTVVALPALSGFDIGLWGAPEDPSHDLDRSVTFLGSSCAQPGFSFFCTPTPSTAPNVPFLSQPTACTTGDPAHNGGLETKIFMDSWENPGVFAEASIFSHDNTEPTPVEIGLAGCNSVEFTPSIEARPTTNVAGAPSGLEVDLHTPQNSDVTTPATAHLKDAAVTLPEGLVLNPGTANGLDGCSQSEFGYESTDPDGTIHTTPGAVNCPEASKVGTVEIETPLIGHPLEGGVFLADPFDNPFDSLIALYMGVDDEATGIGIKLAGRVEIDEDTGQVSGVFEQNPQLPFEHLKLEFFGGSAAPLTTPVTCGEYTTESELVPWTSPEGQTERPNDTWAIERASGEGSCPDSEGERSHAPAFDAGAVHPIAGIESPFVMHLRREDGSQNIRAVNLSPPPGLLAKLAGTQICPDAFLAQAKNKDGEDEEDSPSCPAASRLGRAVAGAGAGPAPYYAPGDVYLAGPYKGAPLSLAIITPANAGPFDLGTIVTRIAAHIDPSTARITAISDPLPEMLEGIPLDIKTVDLVLDKPQFTRNPTSCDPMAVDGLVASTLGALAPVNTRFQVGECGRLGFKPNVFLRLFGKRFTRGSNPRLRAIVVPRPGDANIGFSSVKMPRSLFLDQSHIRTVCTRVQFAADACPPGSVYGSAVATSPLVDYPLQGNVYLRSSNNKLPDLVADLRGPAHQPVRIEVVGKTDSVKGALRNTFAVVPDAPVTKFVLNLQAGKKSLLVASRNLCAGAQRATVKMNAQNGRQALLEPKIKIPCRKQRKGGKGKRRNRAAISQATARP